MVLTTSTQQLIEAVIGVISCAVEKTKTKLENKDLPQIHNYNRLCVTVEICILRSGWRQQSCQTRKKTYGAGETRALDNILFAGIGSNTELSVHIRQVDSVATS